MRAACTTVALVFSALAIVAAQPDRGQNRGTLTGARGPITNAELRVRNTTTEAVPPGTYDVFSSTVGYAVLARRGVAVAAGATVRVDATLATTPTPAHGLDLAKLVQTPALLVMLMESTVPGMRQAFLDGRPHPKNLEPSWLGHSIGRWEGDTLVIDTIGHENHKTEHFVK